MTDVVALFEKYGELLKAQRTAANPTRRANIKIQMLEVKLALSWAPFDIFQ